MKFSVAVILILLLCAFAGAQEFKYTPLYWDNNTDTTASITGTGGDTSQPFLVWPDMAAQLYLNVDTDSDKVQCYFQYALYDKKGSAAYPPASGYFTSTIAGSDSIGLDSTADTGASQIVDISTTAPVRWARAILKGLGTNDKTTAQTIQVHVLEYRQ